MELVMHNVSRVTITSEQDADHGLNCRKLCIQTDDGKYITIAMHGFQGKAIEELDYHSCDKPYP